MQLFFDRYFPGEAVDIASQPTRAAANVQLIAGRFDTSARSESGFMSLLNLAQTVIAADASILAAAGSVPMSAANRFVARSYRFVTGV